MSQSSMNWRIFRCSVCRKEKYKHCEDWGWRIGEHLFCSYTCMRKWEAKEAAKHKKKALPVIVVPPAANRLNDREKEEALKLLREGKKQREVAEIMGCSVSQIDHLARKNGVRKNTQGGGTRTSEEKIRRIRELYAQGMAVTLIAKDMHMSNSTVHKYVYGRDGSGTESRS